MSTEAILRAASTTMLLRQSSQLEVLMVRRNRMIDFVGGAMVFPGGRVDPADADPAWADHAAGWQDTPEDERASRIAAIRETFEESGIVIGDGFRPIPDILTLRRAVEAGTITFLAAMQQVGAVIDLGRLTLFSRWITPPVVPKRFDTRFYLARMPEGQQAVADNHETVATEWVAPGTALRLAAQGERTIVFPTRMNLWCLAQSPDPAAAEGAARMRAHLPVTPRIELRQGRRMICLDDEHGYGCVEEPLELP